MSRYAVSLVALLCASALPQAAPAAAQETVAAARTDGAPAVDLAGDEIGVDEVARGQTGYGLSVFAGSEPERFGVEVVGVLREMDPGTSFIVARLSGKGLEESGGGGRNERESGLPRRPSGRGRGLLLGVHQRGSGADHAYRRDAAVERARPGRSGRRLARSVRAGSARALRALGAPDSRNRRRTWPRRSAKSWPSSSAVCWRRPTGAAGAPRSPRWASASRCAACSPRRPPGAPSPPT